MQCHQNLCTIMSVFLEFHFRIKKGKKLSRRPNFFWQCMQSKVFHFENLLLKYYNFSLFLFLTQNVTKLPESITQGNFHITLSLTTEYEPKSSMQHLIVCCCWGGECFVVVVFPQEKYFPLSHAFQDILDPVNSFRNWFLRC